MASLKGRLIGLLGGAILREATLRGADDLGLGYRRLSLRGEGLRGLDWRAGDKVQILLPSQDVRTYTPVQAGDDEILLCGWRHAGGPGARWFFEASPGQTVRFLGPQRSLSLPDGPVIVVGDETSIAVAASFASRAPGSVFTALQADDPADARLAAEAMGLQDLDIVQAGDTSGLVDAVLRARAASPDAAIGLTGGAELIVHARRLLRERGAGEPRVKTYWASGRAGLD